MTIQNKHMDQIPIKKLSSLTIGDINIDYIVDISDLEVPFTLELSGQFPHPIQQIVGGNGVYFSESARDAGFLPSSLIASIGMNHQTPDTPDISGQEALNRINKSGVVPILSLVQDLPTGRVIILYQPNDRRVTIADRGANAGPIMPLLTMIGKEIISQTDLLYVSGFYLVEKHQRDLIMQIMSMFRDQGSFVLVDVVPHNLFTRFSFESLKGILSSANAISIESATLAGFLDIKGDLNSKENKNRMINALLTAFDFGLVRLNDRSDFIIADQKVQKEIYVPYRARTASARFSDRVLASALFHYLSNDRSIPDDDLWVKEAIETTSVQF